MLTIAVSESWLGSTLAVHVKGVWIGENFFIPIGRLVGADDAFAGLDELWEVYQQTKHGVQQVSDKYLISKCDINLCDTAERHGRCSMEPAELFDEGFCQGWVGLEIFELVRML